MKTAFALVVALITVGCSGNRELLPNTETVLAKGMKIEAVTPNGAVAITAGDGTQRTFSGAGWSKKERLIARDVRWYGSLGLYDPGASLTQHGRLLVDEGKQFFDSESDALRYLYTMSHYCKPVFNRTGLVVGYQVENIAGGEPVRSVEVWQIYIKGSKPHSLRGSNDSEISVFGGDTPETASPNPAPIGYERTLGDQEYVPEQPKS